jgi:hypothetical protein
VGERFEPWNLESFDLVTQELYRLLPAMIHTQPETKKSNQKSKTPMTQAILTLRVSTALATTWSHENVGGSRPDSWRRRTETEIVRSEERALGGSSCPELCVIRAGISGARKSKLRRFAANRIARPTEIRGAELAVKPEKLKVDRVGKDFLTGENVVVSRLGLDPTCRPRKLEKSACTSRIEIRPATARL